MRLRSRIEKLERVRPKGRVIVLLPADPYAEDDEPESVTVRTRWHAL